MPHYTFYLILLIISSCTSKTSTLEWNEYHSNICCDSFNERNILVRSTCYNKDTTIKDGPEIYYSESGKIIKWFWYENDTTIYIKHNKESYRLPGYGAYYNDDGAVETFRGNPFRDFFQYEDGKSYVEVYLPPNADVAIIIRDSVNNRLHNKYVKFLGGDSTGIVKLDTIIENHKYWATYQIYDSVKILCEYTIPLRIKWE